jgi:TonB family protein
LQNFAGTPVVSDEPRTQVPTGESLVVLTRDAALAETVKVLGTEHKIVTVDAEPDLAGELVGKGVAIVDACAVTTPIGRLTDTLKSQFPDLVLIVAGNVTDQSALATQITNGTVYRFLHKPVSEQRVRLFVDAAWRRHGEEIPAEGLAESDSSPPRTALFISGAVVVVLLAAGGWFMTRKPAAAPVSKAVATTERDEQFESLLTRADAALASGSLVTPSRQSAVDLYKQARQRNGNDPRPAAGLEKVINELLSAAEDQLGAQHLDEARKLTDQARAIEPDHVRVAFLSTQIGKERERFVLNQARQAASSGNIEAAIAVLDGAGKQGKHSTLVAEAREELEQKRLDDRVADDEITDLTKETQRVQTSAKADAMARLTLLFNQRLSQDKIIDPPDDSAKSYLAQLVQADATHPSTVLARQALASRTLDEAKAAAHRQDYTGAKRWLAETREAGTDDASIGAVEHDMTAAQETTRQVAEVVSAANLKLAKYVPPVFPVAARQHDASGWVEVQFLVQADGSVSDVIITGAEPVGLFEQAAVDAVKKWRYEPVERNGHATDQRARLRMKFALDK